MTPTSMAHDATDPNLNTSDAGGTTTLPCHVLGRDDRLVTPVERQVIISTPVTVDLQDDVVHVGDDGYVHENTRSIPIRQIPEDVAIVIPIEPRSHDALGLPDEDGIHATVSWNTTDAGHSGENCEPVWTRCMRVHGWLPVGAEEHAPTHYHPAAINDACVNPKALFSISYTDVHHGTWDGRSTTTAMDFHTRSSLVRHVKGLEEEGEQRREEMCNHMATEERRKHHGLMPDETDHEIGNRLAYIEEPMKEAAALAIIADACAQTPGTERNLLIDDNLPHPPPRERGHTSTRAITPLAIPLDDHPR